MRAKLATATAAAEIDSSYRRNIEALEVVQPADLEPGDIEARLGSSWIPAADLRDFVAQLLDVPAANISVAHAEAIATWTVDIDPGERFNVSNTTAWGTARFRASELIEQSLNGRMPTAYDSTRTARASSISRRPSPPARNSNSLRIVSANGSGKTASAHHALPAITTSASTISACAVSMDRI